MVVYHLLLLGEIVGEFFTTKYIELYSLVVTPPLAIFFDHFCITDSIFFFRERLRSLDKQWSLDVGKRDIGLVSYVL